MNKYLLITILLIIFIYITLPYPINAEDNYIIDGNTVYIDDENVYLSAYPHTIYEPGYVYFNLTSKKYNGNIDATFGFNTSLVKPKKVELYNSNTKTWNNFPLSFTKLSQTYQNCDKWYYIKDIPIISNKNYRLRIWIETPISTDINKGKYLFAIKPSFETIQQSIDNNRLYVLDPWFNTSFTDRQKIIITTNGSTIPENYQILLNVTYNSNMQSDFDDLRFTNLTNGKLNFWVESKINSEYVNIWVELSDEIIHPNNDIIYMYYGNSESSYAGDIVDTFISGFDGDLIGWIEIDPNLHISFVNNRLEFTDLRRNEDAYIYQSIDENDNVIIESTYNIISGDSQSIAMIGSMGDIIDDFANMDNGFGLLHGVSTSLSHAVLRIDDTNYFSDGVTPSIGITYYSRTIRTANKTECKWYTDNDRTVEVFSTSKTQSTLPTNLSYVYIIDSWNSGSTQEITGWVDDFYVRKYIINEPIILFNITEYYTNTLHYNVTNNYNHTIESNGIIIVNRSLNEIDNTDWTAKSTNITYWIFTKEINSSGYTNFTIKKDNLNNFSVKLKQYSYYNLNNTSLVNTFNTNQYGIANIDINLIPDDYYIIFINQSLIPPPIKPLYPIQGILIIKDNICLNNTNKIIIYKNNSYLGKYNYSDEITFLNNTNYTLFINYDNIDIINSENFLITFFKNYGYILISVISLIILFGICIYFFNKVRK